MTLKWIKCTVTDKNKEAFSKAQESWIAMSNSDGFIQQLGGWHKKKKNVAHIFAYWEDLGKHDSFMKKAHDEIFKKSNQEDTYSTSIIEFKDGNIDFINWFVEQQNIKFDNKWDINMDSDSFSL